MGSKSLDTRIKITKKVMLKNTADTWSHGNAILTRTMKLPDFFSVISANFQLSQKSNNVVTFSVLRSGTHSIVIQPLVSGLNSKITKK